MDRRPLEWEQFACRDRVKFHSGQFRGACQHWVAAGGEIGAGATLRTDDRTRAAVTLVEVVAARLLDERRAPTGPRHGVEAT